MRKEFLIKLLNLLIDGERLGECWGKAGYQSLEEAIDDMRTLMESISGKNETGDGIPASSAEDFLVVYVDGGSRGNPGPSAAAAVAYFQDGGEAGTRELYLGEKTNNEAEYMAVIEGLKLARMLGASRVLLKLDSELVHRQLTNRYRVKNERLKVLFNEVKDLIGGFEEVLFEHVGREKNREADRLVNAVLDGKLRTDHP